MNSGFMKFRLRARSKLVVSAGSQSFETIQGTAIRAKCIALAFDRQIHAGMRIPVDVLRHGTMQRQVGVIDFDDALGIEVGFAHGKCRHTGVSQS